MLNNFAISLVFSITNQRIGCNFSFFLVSIVAKTAIKLCTISPFFFFSFLGGGGIIPPIAKRINGLLCCYPMPYGDGR